MRLNKNCNINQCESTGTITIKENLKKKVSNEKSI